MKKIIDKIMSAYAGALLETRARVKLYSQFLLILIPLLFFYIIIMNIVASRSLMSPFNIIISGLLIVAVLCFFLLFRGRYEISSSLMTYVVVLGLLMNAYTTQATGSPARFIASFMVFAAPLLFSNLFCGVRVFISACVIAMAGTIIILSSSALLKPEEFRVVVVSMNISFVLIGIIGFLISRINNVTREIRSQDYEKQHEKQVNINSELKNSLQTLCGVLDESSVQMAQNVDSFSDNIQKQASSIEEITAAIEEISAGSENVNTSVESQSSYLTELMGMIEDLFSKTEKMSIKVKSAIARTVEISGEAKSGGNFINSMNTSMNEIRSTSVEMTGILGIINDISDKINLLSLNASIEAARAGDSGRGFAVVADEIGKLADQTSRSVKDIDKLIKQSELEIFKGMKNVEETVTAMKRIIDGVNHIEIMINEIGSSMKVNLESNETISQKGGSLKTLSGNISNASAEQKTAAHSIVSTISYLNEISQSNAAAAEELNAASNEIASMSGDVKLKISAFNFSE